MEKTRMRIGVVSDVVCPWCYIGKRRLEKAMNILANRFDFDIEFFPFELDPHLPEEGIDYREYFHRKFGGEARFSSMTDHVKSVATSEGLPFVPELQRRVPNTRNAHRIIMLAREEGRQTAVVDALFSAYFAEGRDLTDIDTLLTIASDAGMDDEKVSLLLHSNTGKLEIEMAEKELQDLGINSVPLFIINNRTALAGAQSVETFVGFLETAGSGDSVNRVSTPAAL